MKKQITLLLATVLLSLPAMAQSALSPGTPVYIKLQSTLATFMNKAGDQFWGTVTQPVMESGRVVIPAGSTVMGHLTRVSEPRRITGKPTIGLHPDSVTLPNGARYALSAVLVDTSLRDGSDVNEEGQFKGSGHDRHDTRETAIGGGAGVVMGALLGGAEGGLIGAGAGVAATTAHWLYKRRSATLAAGTVLIFEITRPTVVGSGSATNGAE
ncbi:MAG TPA: hypothetical protein VL177_14015 [Terriglobales bacterium]|jgi:hypothetical protein|nr:hypothetical protein [Terriglobales bacterium]